MWTGLEVDVSKSKGDVNGPGEDVAALEVDVCG